MKVKELVEELDKLIPFSDAEDWDLPGLSVGNLNEEICGVACALDANPYTVDKAAQAGANVLVTHHPLFIDAPRKITDDISTSSIAGSTIWHAIQNNVAIVSLHTNLDKSDIAQDFLAKLMGCKRTGRLEEPHGYGGIWDCGSISLVNLASKCAEVFETQPTIWGLSHENQTVHKVAYASGSAGSIGTQAIEQGIDCLICGECSYHRLLEMDEAGVKVIVLGHDASEKPFAQLLSSIIKRITPDTPISVIDDPRRWRVL